MPTPLNRVIVFVADVERCAAFYRDVFGFTVRRSDELSEEWIELETGGLPAGIPQGAGAAGPDRFAHRQSDQPAQDRFLRRGWSCVPDLQSAVIRRVVESTRPFPA